MKSDLWSFSFLAGYLQNEEANKSTFDPSPEASDRWLRTGDVAKISDGYITIEDRLKDVIKYSGFQVNPSELEDILYQDELVHDSAVLGILRPSDGSELPWAFIVPQSSGGFQEPSEEQTRAVMDRLNGMVAGYKKLHGITWIEEVPKWVGSFGEGVAWPRSWVAYTSSLWFLFFLTFSTCRSASGKVLKRELKDKVKLWCSLPPQDRSSASLPQLTLLFRTLYSFFSI